MVVLSLFSLFQQVISARSDSVGMGGVQLCKPMYMCTHTHTHTHTPYCLRRESESIIAYFNFSLCLHVLS